ncbi:hypothetical protein AWM70_21025 [Paenibacillus yonginensis]|uniref:Uncharacterized protein n=1 Tax=Paenibacillus yonginensis TaxID=1462996 RepID=A0A1B1N5R3_9BACL|nr:CcdC protein domain-containing protein [Paenibacillus yonginensis]ANS76759.1 hypothetical protein AWM70_21025 [Paenibacillus yonginensis]
MTQHQWDLIGYGVWMMIIWMTLRQFLQTRRPVAGKGYKLLFGDWMLFAPVPWIAYCMASRGSFLQLLWVVALGMIVAIPYMLTSRFSRDRLGEIKMKPNLLFYLFLFGLPYVRYELRNYVFHSHPLLTPQHRPDIELMLAEYIAVLVIFTFVWRLSMFISYRRLLKQSVGNPELGVASTGGGKLNLQAK